MAVMMAERREYALPPRWPIRSEMRPATSFGHLQNISVAWSNCGTHLDLYGFGH